MVPFPLFTSMQYAQCIEYTASMEKFHTNCAPMSPTDYWKLYDLAPLVGKKNVSRCMAYCTYCEVVITNSACQVDIRCTESSKIESNVNIYFNLFPFCYNIWGALYAAIAMYCCHSHLFSPIGERIYYNFRRKISAVRRSGAFSLGAGVFLLRCTLPRRL